MWACSAAWKPQPSVGAGSVVHSLPTGINAHNNCTKQESRMVVNVLLALPQFSSTLMQRLILKHNNLDCGRGKSCCAKAGRGRVAPVVLSCTLHFHASGCLWRQVILFILRAVQIHSQSCVPPVEPKSTTGESSGEFG